MNFVTLFHLCQNVRVCSQSSLNAHRASYRSIVNQSKSRTTSVRIACKYSHHAYCTFHWRTDATTWAFTSMLAHCIWPKNDAHINFHFKVERQAIVARLEKGRKIAQKYIARAFERECTRKFHFAFTIEMAFLELLFHFRRSSICWFLPSFRFAYKIV